MVHGDIKDLAAKLPDVLQTVVVEMMTLWVSADRASDNVLL